MVATLPPVIFPTLSAVQGVIGNLPGVSPDVSASINIMGKLQWASATFIDDLAQGFGLNKPFGTVLLPTSSGGAISVSTGGVSPKGLFLVTTTVGLTVGITAGIQAWLARRLAGVKQVRIFNRRVA